MLRGGIRRRSAFRRACTGVRAIDGVCIKKGCAPANTIYHLLRVQNRCRSRAAKPHRQYALLKIVPASNFEKVLLIKWCLHRKGRKILIECNKINLGLFRGYIFCCCAIKKRTCKHHLSPFYGFKTECRSRVAKPHRLYA